MKRKGISLIVLIITIVVIIILATAIIVNLANTNLIGNANEAVVKQDFKTMQDELTLYKADKFVETHGNFKAEDLDITDKTDIAKIMPSIVGSKYEDYVLIEDGCIAISADMPEKERTWAMEALGLIKTSTNRPTEPEPTATSVVAIDTIVETSNATITGNDFAYNNPVIPVGFKAYETTDATWNDIDSDGSPDGWNNGLVIADESGNEFVWVPVDGTNVTYTKNFTYPSNYNATANNTSDNINSLPIVNNIKIDENTQITKYGGFYIGRYEAGIPEKNGTPQNIVGTPIVQQGATVWTNITSANAIASSQKMYETSTNIKSGIIRGKAWDAVCAWIHNEKDENGNVKYSVLDSTTWGNYSNTTGSSQFDKDGTTKISGIKQTAGKSEFWKAKNIYDFAGNVWEWVGECSSSSDRVYRGGSRTGSGASYPASYRATDNSVNHDNISFRIMLYVM